MTEPYKPLWLQIRDRIRRVRLERMQRARRAEADRLSRLDEPVDLTHPRIRERMRDVQQQLRQRGIEARNTRDRERIHAELRSSEAPLSNLLRRQAD